METILRDPSLVGLVALLFFLGSLAGSIMSIEIFGRTTPTIKSPIIPESLIALAVCFIGIFMSARSFSSEEIAFALISIVPLSGIIALGLCGRSVPIIIPVILLVIVSVFAIEFNRQNFELEAALASLPFLILSVILKNKRKVYIGSAFMAAAASIVFGLFNGYIIASVASVAASFASKNRFFKSPIEPASVIGVGIYVSLVIQCFSK